MRVLFHLRSARYGRHFEHVLRRLLSRGHQVGVVLSLEYEGAKGDDSLLRELAAEFPGFSFDVAPEPADPELAELARQLRFGIDYLRFLRPAFAHAEALRERARERAPRAIVRAARVPGAGAPLSRVLRRLDAALPVDEATLDGIRARQPDVVLVSPLVELGSMQGETVRAAHAVGLPAGLLVASWDNLTNKGVVRDRLDLVVVWNERQVDEAVELHGLARERIVATGAHTYDQWFDWRPSSTRAAFCERIGLDPSRPLVLYAGSSGFIAPDEARFVAEWVRRLRDDGGAALDGAGVLVRPHPDNPQDWQAAGVTDLPGVAVWPPQGENPTSEDAKSSFFDSIHHAAAVVGINTSALVESAIVGRPVLTVVTDSYRTTQEGTLHFDHLTADGGVLHVAHSWPEHWRQLGAALDGSLAHEPRTRAFLERFVRPRGLEAEATGRVVEAIEALASTTPAPVRASRTDRVLRRLLVRWARRAAEPPASRRVSSRRRVRPREGAPLRLLVVLDAPDAYAAAAASLAQLAARGHAIDLAFGRGGPTPELSSTVGSEAWNSRDLKSRPH